MGRSQYNTGATTNMKKYTENQRIANIFLKAANLGFEFNLSDSIDEVLINAENFLIEYATATEDYCPVTNNGRGQHASYADRMGFECWFDGDICSFDPRNPADYKYYHSTIVNSEGDVVNLYDLQGENQYNTPAIDNEQ